MDSEVSPEREENNSGEIIEKRGEVAIGGDVVVERKGRIMNWLKKPENFMLVGILFFAFAIRLYYFFLTKGQPLWWDEAAYGSLARNYVSHMWDDNVMLIGETLIRPPLFPLMWSYLLKLGFNEIGVRFLLEFVPSVLSVYFVFLIGKELYNYRVGLIAGFIFSVLWIHLFYTVRLLTNVPALVFLFSSIYFFVIATKGDFDGKFFGISLILLSLSTLIRYPNGLVFIVYLLFLLITWRVDLLKKGKFWISGIIGIFPLLLFFLINYLSKGNIFPALLGGEAAESVRPEIAFYVLDFVPSYLLTPFFILFLFGLFIAVFDLFVGFDHIKRSQKLKSDLLLVLILVFIFAYFIFYIRGAEDRWLFPASISLVMLLSLGLDWIFVFTKKYGKYVGLVIVLGILAFGAYQQLNQGDELIKGRQYSFSQFREGFEWIHDNTEENAIVLGQGIGPYTVYFAQRIHKRLPANVSDVDGIEADYLVVHALTEQPIWINDYLTQNQENWQPVNALFFDAEQTQASFVVYKNIPA